MTPDTKPTCNCTANVNGGMHDSNCAVAQAEPLTAALHAHIKEVAARPLDMRMLIELERTCLLARELMAVGKMPNAMARHKMIHPQYMGGDSYGDGAMAMPISPMGTGASFSTGAAYSSPNETFGVTAIRELVAGLAALNQKPEESAVIKEMKETINRLEGHLKDALKEKPAVEAIGVAS